jgi:hypothetical protein
MKSRIYHAVIFLLIAAFCAISIAGCHSNGTEGTGNKAMSEQQKAIIAAHKQKADQ